jgi:FemAB-related protein (PEP-CTERM system-associated)
MIVRDALAADTPALDAFVHAHRHGTPFHLSAWREQVRDAGPHESHSLVACDAAGAVRGFVPLFRVRSMLGGDSLVAVPYGVYGGVLALDDAAARELVNAACRRADELGVRHLELRHVDPLDDAGVRLETSRLYVTFVKDLPADVEGCLESIPRKSRATTRHARDKHGMRFVEGNELLPRFYELFLDNKTALGSPCFSQEYFENLLTRFGERAWLSGVEMDGVVIAAAISFVHGNTLNPYYSGSLSGTERLGSMNFLYWRLMERAVETGLTRFDFGRSRVDTGAYAFKKNMGFEPTPLHYQFYLRGDAELPSVNPSNRKYERFQALWRRLPRFAHRYGGPLLMRHLP